VPAARPASRCTPRRGSSKERRRVARRCIYRGCIFLCPPASPRRPMRPSVRPTCRSRLPFAPRSHRSLLRRGVLGHGLRVRDRARGMRRVQARKGWSEAAHLRAKSTAHTPTQAPPRCDSPWCPRTRRAWTAGWRGRWGGCAGACRRGRQRPRPGHDAPRAQGGRASPLLASSPGSSRRTAVCTSRLVSVCFLA
jgi:hypothetical protein